MHLTQHPQYVVHDIFRKAVQQVLLLTFVTAMLLNLGTNFLLGTISCESNSVTSILQLALSLDYVVIFATALRKSIRRCPCGKRSLPPCAKASPKSAPAA